MVSTLQALLPCARTCQCACADRTTIIAGWDRAAAHLSDIFKTSAAEPECFLCKGGYRDLLRKRASAYFTLIRRGCDSFMKPQNHV